MKPRNVRAWLAAVVLAALAPIAGWAVWLVHEDVRAVDDRTATQLQQSATAFAQSVDRELGSSLDALTVLSQSEIFQQGRIAAMGRLLHGRPRRDWDSIFLLDPQGAVVLDTAQHPSPPALLKDIHVAAMRKLAPVVSGVGSQAGVAIAMPIMQGGHARYVLGVRLSDSVWPRLAAAASLPDGGQVRLFDAQAHLISESGALPGPVYAEWDTVPVSNWVVRVAVPAAPVDAQRRHVVWHAFATSGVALLLGALLASLTGWAFVRRAGL